MRKIITVAFILLVTVVQAQTNDNYRLREPSTQAYVDNVAAVLQRAELTYIPAQYEEASVEATTIADEITWRYLNRNQFTYDQLAAVYRMFVTGEEYFNTPIQEQLLRTIISLWLDENSPDLDETNVLEFDDFRIEFEPLFAPRDNYAQVQWGYFLRVIIKPEFHLKIFNVNNINYIAVPVEDGYILPEMPVAIHSDLLAAGDFNDDDLPDVAYVHSSHIGNSYNSGSMVIASLHGDNQFELLDQLSYFQGGYEFPPSQYNWWFTVLGDGQNVGVIENQNLFSNWDCTYVQIRLYGWSVDNRLVFQSGESLYPDTVPCLVQQAELAMWSHDYNKAVEFYEQAFELGTPSAEFMPYTQIRLGFAYLLTGRTQEADAIYSELAASDDEFAQAVLAAYQRDPRALPVCQAMYNYPFNSTVYLQATGTIQSSSGGFNRMEVGMRYFNLDRATCDLEFNVDALLEPMTFTTDESPVAQVEALGLEIGDVLEADFNLDGQTEWLIWLNAPSINPLFFSPKGNTYTLTRPQGSNTGFWRLHQPSEYNRVAVITLPNNSEQVLVNINFDSDKREILNCAETCGGGGDFVPCAYGNSQSTPTYIGRISVWRMQDGALEDIFTEPTCELVEVEELFTSAMDNLELRAGDYNPDSNELIPAIYTWSDEAQTYVLPAQPQATNTVVPATPTLSPTPERIYNLSNYSFIWLRTAFVNRDYRSVVDGATMALSTGTGEIPQFEMAFRYYLALALEALERPHDALNEYITIYESAPDSSWGILAALHLEVISED
jgi:tetratricopeptide (TPR) repeat protein